MCRNITILRGLEPPATPDEVESAARQYVRKVGGLSTARQMTSPEVEAAIAQVAAATRSLLGSLPARKSPPATLPPLRRQASRETSR